MLLEVRFFIVKKEKTSIRSLRDFL